MKVVILALLTFGIIAVSQAPRVLKDSADRCGFAFFSDQNGTIYQGEALR